MEEMSSNGQVQNKKRNMMVRKPLKGKVGKSDLDAQGNSCHLRSCSDFRQLRLRQHFSNNLSEIYDKFSALKQKQHGESTTQQPIVLYDMKILVGKAPEMGEINDRLKRIRLGKFNLCIQKMQQIKKHQQYDFNRFILTAQHYRINNYHQLKWRNTKGFRTKNRIRPQHHSRTGSESLPISFLSTHSHQPFV